MHQIKEADNEDKDFSVNDRLHNTGQNMKTGSVPGIYDPRPSTYEQNGRRRTDDQTTDQARSHMANTNTEVPYDVANQNEEAGVNIMDQRQFNFANSKHESGPGNMQGAPEDTKDNRMPVLIDFTGVQVISIDIK